MEKREPIVILQPSLHTISEYVDIVIGEAESLGVDVSDLRTEYDADPDGELVGDLADDCLARLSDAGYANAEEYDALIIMDKGDDLPDGWATE